MALIKTGIAIGQISCRVAGNVFSRNRGGAYVRNGAIPTRSTTPFAEAAKARLANFSKGWADLTDAQRMAWKNWATQNPVINRLGDSIRLAGNMAFVQLNTTIDLAGGTPITDPPIAAPPLSPTVIAGTYDIGAGTFQLGWAGVTLGATECLAMEAAVVDNPGVNYVENLYKLVNVTAAAATSPLANVDTFLAARFGTLAVGQRVFWRAYVIDNATGLRSAPAVTNGTIIST